MMTEFSFSTLRELQNGLIGGSVPFASWRLPGNNEPETIGSQAPAEVIEDTTQLSHKGEGFAIAPFRENERAYFIPREWHCRGFSFEPLKLKLESDVLPLPVQKSRPSERNEYLQKIRTAIEYINESTLTKVVLSRIVAVDLPDGFNASVLFENLCQTYPDAFVYLVYLPGKGLWSGASPELLAKIDSGKVKTMALAGTRKQGSKAIWSNKEVEEHLWVSRYIAEVLEASGASQVRKSEFYTSTAGPVEHLRTDFTAQLPVGASMQFIQQLHPTPAICGWPKQQALQLISELEAHPREFYTGFLGPVSGIADNYEFYVNLRCLQLIGNQAFVYVGGGITGDSNPEAEWEETVLKSETMLKVIKKC